MEACRDLCLTAPYRCHSFDYGDTGERVCRLSHHTSTTLTQIQVRKTTVLPNLANFFSARFLNVGNTAFHSLKPQFSHLKGF